MIVSPPYESWLFLCRKHYHPTQSLKSEKLFYVEASLDTYPDAIDYLGGDWQICPALGSLPIQGCLIIGFKSAYHSGNYCSN